MVEFQNEDKYFTAFVLFMCGNFDGGGGVQLFNLVGQKFGFKAKKELRAPLMNEYLSPLWVWKDLRPKFAVWTI